MTYEKFEKSYKSYFEKLSKEDLRGLVEKNFDEDIKRVFFAENDLEKLLSILFLRHEISQKGEVLNYYLGAIKEVYIEYERTYLKDDDENYYLSTIKMLLEDWENKRNENKDKNENEKVIFELQCMNV